MVKVGHAGIANSHRRTRSAWREFHFLFHHILAAINPPLLLQAVFAKLESSGCGSERAKPQTKDHNWNPYLSAYGGFHPLTPGPRRPLGARLWRAHRANEHP